MVATALIPRCRLTPWLHFLIYENCFGGKSGCRLQGIPICGIVPAICQGWSGDIPVAV